MIPNVLTEAIADIEEYQRTRPDWYDHRREDNDRVKEAMIRLIAKFDCLSCTTNQPHDHEAIVRRALSLHGINIGD